MPRVITSVERILNTTAATTLTVGSWYNVDPSLDRLGFQINLFASSVGATCTATVRIEGSFDGTYASSVGVVTFSALTNNSTTYISQWGAATGSSVPAFFPYIRANLTSLTTSTAGSAGFPTVQVYAAAAQIGK